MFVTANKNVNIRLNDPQVASPCGGFVPVNSQVDVINIVAGQIIDGNSVWYVSNQNQYLWSGGFVQTSDLLLDDDNQPIDLVQDVLMAVYATAVSELMSQFTIDYPYCQGLGFGLNGTDFFLNIFADKAPDSQPPATFNYRGVKLNLSVQVTGGAKACSIFQDQNNTLLMGGTVADSILASNSEYGSRTAYININKTGQYLLTCYHVACASLLAKKTTSCTGGCSAEMPAPASGSPQTPSQFPVFEGSIDSQSDYAIIDVSGQQKKFQNSIPGVGDIAGFYSNAEIPAKLSGITSLVKFGATSQENDGSIFHYTASAISIDYSDVGFGTIQMYGLITAKIPCLPGDSGGPVVDQNNKLLGYIIAADKVSGGNCYIMPVAGLFLNNDFSLI